MLSIEESRFKRMLIHSASPNERKKNCNYESKTDITNSKSKKSLKFFQKLSISDQKTMSGTPQIETSKGDAEELTEKIILSPLDHMYAASTDQPETSPGEDHLNYCLRDTASIYREHSIIKSFKTDQCPSHELECLGKLMAVSDFDSKKIAANIMQLPPLAAAIRNIFLQEITFKLDNLCGTTQKSALRSPFRELTDKTYLTKIITEMEQRCPLVLDILIAMCCPAHQNLKDTNYTVAAIYGMVMHSRNPQLAAFQKIVAVSCIRHHAGNGVS